MITITSIGKESTDWEAKWITLGRIAVTVFWGGLLYNTSANAPAPHLLCALGFACHQYILNAEIKDL